MRVKLAVLSLALVSVVAAQDKHSADTKQWYTMVKSNILKSAEKMPEANFGYKPTDSVRSFGQLLAHIADANNNICAMAKGEKRERSTVEKTATERAAINKALQESFTYCDGVYDSMTDAKGGETIKFFGGERTRLGVLNFNTAHDFEHYGNLVTYMRMKGIVPPSSEGR